MGRVFTQLQLHDLLVAETFALQDAHLRRSHSNTDAAVALARLREAGEGLVEAEEGALQLHDRSNPGIDILAFGSA